MGEVKKINQVAKHLEELKAIGYSIPSEAYKALQEKRLFATGVKQVWACKELSCSQWRLELLVRATGTTCTQGHEAYLLLESPKEQEDSPVVLAINLPKSPPILSLPKNIQLLQGSGDKDV